MTDGERLLAAVIDAPDDDLPRLVYADWLEEHGDAAGRVRAAFIRLQVELARLASDDPRRPALEERERAEWRGLWPRAYHADLPQLDKVRWGTGRFEEPQLVRGFVELLRVRNWKVLADHGAALFRAAPIRHLQVDFELPTPGTMKKLAAWPLLRRLRALSMDYRSYRPGIGDPAARALAASPHLGGLRELSLVSDDITQAGVRELLAAPWLSGLRRLDLTYNPIGDEGTALIAASPAVGGLEELLLRRTEAGNRSARAFAESPSPGGLRLLDLSGNHGIGAPERRRLTERFGDRVKL